MSLLAFAGRQNASRLTASANPPSVTGFIDGELRIGITEPVQVVPVGGQAPITHAWSQISGGPITITPTTISDTVQFSCGNTPVSGVFRDLVSDATGATFPVDVSVSLS